MNARLWKRLSESADSDDNPGISDYIGRGEPAGELELRPRQHRGCDRAALAGFDAAGLGTHRMAAESGQGLGGSKSNLRLHTALFSGYGDSMIDYNRKRTVFSVGLSLVDF